MRCGWLRRHTWWPFGAKGWRSGEPRGACPRSVRGFLLLPRPRALEPGPRPWTMPRLSPGFIGGLVLLVGAQLLVGFFFQALPGPEIAQGMAVLTLIFSLVLLGISVA